MSLKTGLLHAAEGALIVIDLVYGVEKTTLFNDVQAPELT